MNALWMPLWWRWLFDDFVLWHLGAGARDVFVAVWFGWDEVRFLWIYYWSGESNYYLLKRNREDLSHNSQISRDNVLIWNHRPLVLREFLHLNYISEVVDRLFWIKKTIKRVTHSVFVNIPIEFTKLEFLKKTLE